MKAKIRFQHESDYWSDWYPIGSGNAFATSKCRAVEIIEEMTLTQYHDYLNLLKEQQNDTPR